MNTLAVSVLVLVCFNLPAKGQLAVQISAGLRSADWIERQAAFGSLTAEKTARSEETKAALVGLLLREDRVTDEINRQGLGTDEKYGEGYGLYVGRLGSLVMEIAQKEPDRADVWPALLYQAYNPGSVFVSWLSKYGDKAAPILLAQLKDPFYREVSNALDALAQIARYERQPSAQHKLTAKEVETIEAAIRAAVDDQDEVVRSNAVDALAIIGNREDLAVLERIALTDPQVVTNGGRTGAEIRFFGREHARAAADRLRKRLDSPQGNAGQPQAR